MAELLRGTLNFIKIAYSDLQQKNKYVNTLRIMTNRAIVRVKGFTINIKYVSLLKT
jgi:hypothetical protein